MGVKVDVVSRIERSSLVGMVTGHVEQIYMMSVLSVLSVNE